MFHSVLFLFLFLKDHGQKNSHALKQSIFFGPATVVSPDSVMAPSGAQSGWGRDEQAEGPGALLSGICALGGGLHQAAQSVMQALK